MAKSAAELARMFERSASQVPPTVHDTIIGVSQRTKAIYLAGAATAGLVPGRRMRGVGKKGAAWGVGYETSGSGGDETAIVKFKGPVHLVNNDTSAHLVVTPAKKSQMQQQGKALVQLLTGKKVKGVKKSKKKGLVLALPWGVRAYANHPGTHGKNFFRPADDFARSEVKRIVGASRREMLMRGGFREGGL